MNAKALILLLLLATQSAAQGFSGLGSDAEDYLIPDPNYVITFPKDHGAHPGYRIEWWYLTANLEDAEGTEYGLQWTLFRSALSPDDSPPPIWMGHAAITSPTQHFAAERFARGGAGQAGVRAAPFEAWIDNWQMSGIERGNLSAQGADFGYEMKFSAEGPFVMQGANGYSVKSADGQASHYYSQPFYRISGRLELPSGPVDVAGTAWLDREWSSQPLSADQTGWDWISLSFETGERLMAFQLRGTDTPYITGTWIDVDGASSPLETGEVQFEPLELNDVAGREVPTSWRITLPSRELDVEITSLNPNAWMPLTVSYWEGPVQIRGSHAGRGYLEMTGYE